MCRRQISVVFVLKTFVNLPLNNLLPRKMHIKFQMLLSRVILVCLHLQHTFGAPDNLGKMVAAEKPSQNAPQTESRPSWIKQDEHLNLVHRVGRHLAGTADGDHLGKCRGPEIGHRLRDDPENKRLIKRSFAEDEGKFAGTAFYPTSQLVFKSLYHPGEQMDPAPPTVNMLHYGNDIPPWHSSEETKRGFGDRMVFYDEKRGFGDRMLHKRGFGDRMLNKRGFGDRTLYKKGFGDRIMLYKKGFGDRTLYKRGFGDRMLE